MTGARTRHCAARFATTLLALALALATGTVAAQSTPPAFTDSAALEAETSRVASQLRCVVCQGLSIEDSPSELARNMRAVVRDQLAEGRSEQEIRDYFVARYGEWVLLQPRASGFNLAVYILPLVLLLAGVGVIVVLARRWSSGGPGTTEAAEDPDLAAWDELVPRE